MRRHFLTLSLTTMLICGGAPVQAEALDANGQKVKALFTKLLEEQKQNVALQGTQLEYKGDLNVEQAEGYYAVTMPHLTLKYPSGYKFEVGMVAINAAPHEQDGSWKMSIALPTPMKFYNSAGEVATNVNIASQRSSGVWEEELGYFSKLDANFQAINLAGKEDDFNVNLPNIRVIYDLDKNENQLWSGPVSFTMDGLNIDADGIQNALSIGKVDLAMEMFDYNPNGMIAYQDALQEAFTGQEANPEAQLSPNEFNNLLQAFISALGDGFVSNYTISDFVINGKDDAQFQYLKLDKATFGFDLTGLLEKSLDIDLRIGYDGMDIQPVPANMPALAPTNLKLDIAIDDLPVEELQALGTQTAGSATQNPGAAQMQAMGAAMQLPAILSKANSKITLTNNYIGNDTYRVTLDGSAKPNLQSPLMTEADFQTSIRGFDAITQSLTQTIQQGGPQTAQLQSIMAGLMMIKGFAKPESVDNEIVHKLNFKLTPLGQFLLNDQDMSMMLGLQPKTAPQTTQEPAQQQQ